MLFTQKDEHYMRMAIRQAELAQEAGDVPVGAVIVQGDRILGQAHNQVELLKDPTAHAEIIAITQAANTLGNWRLTETTLYVTKEPCPMCNGAIRLARIARVVYGASEIKIQDETQAPEIKPGVLEPECRSLLQAFFRKLRSP